LRIYIDSQRKDLADNISAAVDRVVAVDGFEPVSAKQFEQGSWFGRWIAKSKVALSQQEMQDRLRKLERAMETQLYMKPQVDVDSKHAESIGGLLHVLAGTQNAVVQIGSIILVKITGQDGQIRVAVKTLTAQQMLDIERDDALLRNPNDLLKYLFPTKGDDAIGSATDSKSLL
jgi:hypothetical protein